MDEQAKYRLQYFSQYKDVLAIDWAWDRKDYVPGDFYVRAIKAETNVAELNKKHFAQYDYTTSMSLEEARDFIAKNRNMCGEVRDCKGLSLEDECVDVEFKEPIFIRTLS